MGEVYRARDTRLAREVAIKLLPASFATDPDRLHRFEQEARAAGAITPRPLGLPETGLLALSKTGAMAVMPGPVDVQGAADGGPLPAVLLGQLHARVGGTSVSFDDPEVLEAAIMDPVSFAGAFKKPLFIDEVQRAGDGLLRAIKAEVDGRPSPGQFVLAGSTRFLTVPTLSESLAGRVRIVDLWPFSQGETVASWGSRSRPRRPSPGMISAGWS